MRFPWLLVALLAFQTSSAHALNRCVQEDGTVTYSDKDCVTVAPGSYAKQIHLVKRGSKRTGYSCTAIRELTEEVTKMMIKGLSTSDVYTTLGGMNDIDPVTSNVVSYVYEHEHKINEINPVKMGAYSFARCNNGDFGNPSKASTQ